MNSDQSPYTGINQLLGNNPPHADVEHPYIEEELRSHSQSWPTNQAFKTADRIAAAAKAILDQTSPESLQDDRYVRSEPPGGFRDQINAIRAEMEAERQIRADLWLEIQELRAAIAERRKLKEKPLPPDQMFHCYSIKYRRTHAGMAGEFHYATLQYNPGVACPCRKCWDEIDEAHREGRKRSMKEFQ